MSDRIKGASPAIKTVFIAAGVLFVVTILAGMYYYFSVIQLGGATTKQAKLQSKQDPASLDHEDADEVARLEKVIPKTKRRITISYGLVLITFLVGALLASIGTGGVLIPPPKHVAKFQIVSIASDAQTDSALRAVVLLLNETDGRTWHLVRGARGALEWKCLPHASVTGTEKCLRFAAVAGQAPSGASQPGTADRPVPSR